MANLPIQAKNPQKNSVAREYRWQPQENLEKQDKKEIPQANTVKAAATIGFLSHFFREFFRALKNLETIAAQGNAIIKFQGSHGFAFAGSRGS